MEYFESVEGVDQWEKGHDIGLISGADSAARDFAWMISEAVFFLSGVYQRLETEKGRPIYLGKSRIIKTILKNAFKGIVKEES